MRYLFMCKSLTYAQRTAKTLEQAGVFSSIVKSPTELSARGCGYSVAVAVKKAKRAAEIIRSSKLPQGRVYLEDADGSFREVSL